MGKNISHNEYTVEYRVLYPADHMADWELQLVAPAQDHNSKFKVCLLLNLYHFYTIIKLKNRKSKYLKLIVAHILYQKIYIYLKLRTIYIGLMGTRNSE